MYHEGLGFVPVDATLEAFDVENRGADQVPGKPSSFWFSALRIKVLKQRYWAMYLVSS